MERLSKNASPWEAWGAGTIPSVGVAGSEVAGRRATDFSGRTLPRECLAGDPSGTNSQSPKQSGAGETGLPSSRKEGGVPRPHSRFPRLFAEVSNISSQEAKNERKPAAPCTWKGTRAVTGVPTLGQNTHSGRRSRHEGFSPSEGWSLDIVEGFSPEERKINHIVVNARKHSSTKVSWKC